MPNSKVPLPVTGKQPGTGKPAILLTCTKADSNPSDVTVEAVANGTPIPIAELSKAEASIAEVTKVDLTGSSVAKVSSQLPLDPNQSPLDDDHHTYLFECCVGDDIDEARYGTIPVGAYGEKLLLQAGFDHQQAKLGRGIIISQYNTKGEFSHYVVKFDKPRVKPSGETIEYEYPPGAPDDVDVSPELADQLRYVTTNVAWTAGPEYADGTAGHNMVGLNILAAKTRFLQDGNVDRFIRDAGLDDIPQVAWVDGRKVRRLNFVFLEQNWGSLYGGPEELVRTPVLHVLCQAIEQRGGFALLVEPPATLDQTLADAKAALFVHFNPSPGLMTRLFEGEPYSDKSNRRRLKAARRLVK